MQFALQFSACIVEAGSDVLWERERVTGFRDTYGPEVSGPFVHVLKNMVVNGLEVPGIKCA
jgi:hypothetical protein